jgi:predicted HTH transcriptional regulator
MLRCKKKSKSAAFQGTTLKSTIAPGLLAPFMTVWSYKRPNLPPVTGECETITAQRATTHRPLARTLGYIEQWGSGLQRIRMACQTQGLQAPRIRERADFIDVEFFREVPDTIAEPPDTGSEPPDTGSEPPDTGSEPPDTISEPPDTGSEPPDTISEPPDTISEPPDTISEPPDSTPQAKILAEVENTEFVTTTRVMSILNVSARRAREILKAMTEAGQLEQHGSARRTHYVRTGALAHQEQA